MRIIAGKNRGTNIITPQGQDTRPTLDRVRENLFNILGRKVVDADVLDLFSGSGALAFESLSRGAKSAVLCDHDSRANKCELANAEKLRMTAQAQIFLGDWKQALAKSAAEGKLFDIVFLDPPYAMNDLTLVTSSLAELLKEGAVIVIEHPSGSFPEISDGFTLTDTRRYGYAAISFLSCKEKSNE